MGCSCCQLKVLGVVSFCLFSFGDVGWFWRGKSVRACGVRVMVVGSIKWVS